MTQRRHRPKDKQSWRPSRRHLWLAWAGVVVCGGLVLTGISLVIAGIRELRLGSASLNWPMAQAVITHEEMVKGFRAEGQWGIGFAAYDRKVSVRYTVHEREYTTEFKMAIDRPSPANVSHTPSFRASAPTGERIPLYYNPANPSEVTLHPGNRELATYGIVYGATTSVVFSMFVIVLAWWLSKACARRSTINIA